MESKPEEVLGGRIVAAGLAAGTALIEDETVPVPRHKIPADRVQEEQGRLSRALEALRRNLRYHIEADHGADDSDLQQVLRAHEMMLADEELLAAARRRIAEENRNAEWAVAEEGEEVIRRFEELRDPYLRARAEDFRDLVTMLLEALRAEGLGAACPLRLPERPVIVARNFHPSTALRARRIGAVAFVAESQATVSHAAIILKGLGIPVLGGVAGLLEHVGPGDDLVVDAMEGRVIVRPDRKTRAKYELAHREVRERYERLAGLESPAPEAVRTQDGCPIRLLGNIENPRQLPMVIQACLEGIGLFRTEFLALERGRVPGEQEQVAVYREVLRAMAGRPVIIRTLDIGADKAGGLTRSTGANPALGVRGLRRHLLREPGELETQLRAILRAGTDGDARILFPMVTRVADVRAAKEHVERVKRGLVEEGVPFAAEIPVGAMIEIPAAAISVREILEEVDFVSIGTNDLLQYFTAADRDNPQVLTYQDSRDPAFLWLLEWVARSAAAVDRMGDVGVCGEIASDPGMIPILVRLGYSTLSVSPALAERARRAIAESSVRVDTRHSS